MWEICLFYSQNNKTLWAFCLDCGFQVLIGWAVIWTIQKANQTGECIGSIQNELLKFIHQVVSRTFLASHQL